ncbi:MAG: helix-turn-helix transcriptional regulator, partial [Melioribacteraceae bacterium]|nr:helix-turn-helix transcriptional regulator [Melioribacteraceae bacterium]
MTKRQAEIIDESIKLIADKGIQGLTIKNLSKAIGVSEPAIYRHFENKQG